MTITARPAGVDIRLDTQGSIATLSFPGAADARQYTIDLSHELGFVVDEVFDAYLDAFPFAGDIAFENADTVACWLVENFG